MLRFIAQQVGAEPLDLAGDAERDQTRRKHAVEVMREYDFAAFSVKHYRALSPWLTEQARGTDNAWRRSPCSPVIFAAAGLWFPLCRWWNDWRWRVAPGPDGRRTPRSPPI